MKSVLAGKKFTPPIRGEATIDIIKSPTRRDGTTLVTKIQVKNTSAGPIPADGRRDVVRQEEQPDSWRQGRDQRSAAARRNTNAGSAHAGQPEHVDEHAAVQSRERHGEDARDQLLHRTGSGHEDRDEGASQKEVNA